MDKTYSPQQIEQKHYQHWEHSGYFNADEQHKSAKGNWSLMIPPPNVTGSLHMGHAFQDTIMDFLSRHKRMQGYNTLWQPGTDHAGIATQMIVERQLAAQGADKQDLGREAFVDKVWQWKQESGGTISQQLRRMGVSVDWRRERFTMDEPLSKAVIKVFCQLYDEGLIYRGTRLVNWDPKFKTAISDLEVVNVEEQGKLYYVRYPLVEAMGELTHLLIATTRPETILADGALAVHPHDKRYTHLLGKRVWVPMTDRQIPVIADDYVDQEFGSGCVKITPAHDFNDYQVGQRHEMEVINLFTEDAHLNNNAPAKYVGLERFAARQAIVADLQQAGLLAEVKDHTFKRPYGDRSNVVVEPYLTDQWFMDTKVIAKRAIDTVKEGQIEFVPNNWQKTYFQWLENIQDWCISRQLWWGHRIPAWYGDNGQIFVAANELEAYDKAKRSGYTGQLTQDNDVLDTWFSSALWPFSTLGWPDKSDSLTAYYPTSVLVTGFDIIFFWVARMIMFGLKFTDDIPFKQVYVHGLVRDRDGQKMSKSKGNVLDPIDIIDGIALDDLIAKRTYGMMQPQKAKAIAAKTQQEFPNGITAYGCDALRFTFMAMASTGRDIRFDTSRCEGYRNFCNKLWNATRFCLANLTHDTLAAEPVKPNLAINQWINSRLHRAIAQVDQHIKDYRFDLVAAQIYELIWRDFCDWYIEAAKLALQQHCHETNNTLVYTLDTLCRLAHPIMPFITEEIWQYLPIRKVQPSIMLSSYPESQNNRIDYAIEAQFQWVQELIMTVRSLRSKANIKPNQSISLVIENLSAAEQQTLQRFADMVYKFCKVEELQHNAQQGYSAALRHLKVTIPFSGSMDLQAEKRRLQKDLDKVNRQLQVFEQKLNNPAYLDKAPTAIINKTKQMYQESKTAQQQLQQTLAQLP